MNIPPNLIKFLDVKFKPEDELKKKLVVKIKWRGKFISTQSGKSLWNGIGPARNAFNRLSKDWFFREVWGKEFPTSVTHTTPNFRYVQVDKKRFSEFVFELEQLGLLEFVVINENS